MYKSRLQELCHHRLWNLPEYFVTKNGPDHKPDFGASITVNGFVFETQTPAKSSKMAQNEVAKLALDYFSVVPFFQAMPTAFQPPPQPLMPVSGRQPSLLLQQQHKETPCFISLRSQPSMPEQSPPQPFIFSSSGSPDCTKQNDKLAVLPMSPQIVKDNAQSPAVNALGLVFKDHEAHKKSKRMYKNQLQNYAHKKNWKFPVYSCEREGPPHGSRFKCSVTLDGKTYTSDDVFSTIKDAENDVARVAWTALSQLGAQELIEDDCNIYKNLLQELAQREKVNLPIYKTKESGEGHFPNFVSTVEIEGDAFTGQASKTKKQAEMTAAKVAYHAIRKRKSGSLVVAPTVGGKLVPQVLSCKLESNITNGPQQIIMPNASINLNSCSDILKLAEERGKSGSLVVSPTFGGKSVPQVLSCKLESNITNDPQQINMPNASINLNSCSDILKLAKEKGSDATTTCDRDFNLNHECIQNAHHLSSANEETPSKRICMYPRKENAIYSEGGSVVLPMSDDKWVALSLAGNQN